MVVNVPDNPGQSKLAWLSQWPSRGVIVPFGKDAMRCPLTDEDSLRARVVQAVDEGTQKSPLVMSQAQLFGEHSAGAQQTCVDSVGG